MTVSLSVRRLNSFLKPLIGFSAPRFSFKASLARAKPLCSNAGNALVKTHTNSSGSSALSPTTTNIAEYFCRSASKSLAMMRR
ncbi:hypothetical protein D9M68_863370 [compost metagenome]